MARRPATAAVIVLQWLGSRRAGSRAIFPLVIKSRADGRAQGHLQSSELLLAKFKLPIGPDQQSLLQRGLRICQSSEWLLAEWLAAWLPGYGSKLEAS